MFNDLRVSNSINEQVPNYLPQEYPNFVNFVRDYYRFLETNSNPLDIIHGIQNLIDIDTYTGIDPSSLLYRSIDSEDTTIIVKGHVKYPSNSGLLKIDEEVIFYNQLEYSGFLGPGQVPGDIPEIKVTFFKGCRRGYTYNNLNIDTGFSPNISTVAQSHVEKSVVYNQSYTYILYFLEQIRSQYLIDFPENILEKNLNTINIDSILKRIKDFYNSKGTPNGIDFYFKFLFQKKTQFRNFSESLYTASESTFQDKDVVRLANLDGVNPNLIVNNTIIQKGLEFSVQTSENIYSSSAVVDEYEVVPAEKLVTTNLTKIIALPKQINNVTRLYVDSTDGFENTGFIRILDSLIEYSDKGTNYFDCVVTPNIADIIGKIVYDRNTLAYLKSDPSKYFVVYAAIQSFEIDNNYFGYLENDLGVATNVTTESDNRIIFWNFNETTPVDINEGFISGINKLFYTDDAVITSFAKTPFKYPEGELISYLTNVENLTTQEVENIKLSDDDIYIKIPRTFTQLSTANQEKTTAQFPVGILRDGTALFNWKSNATIVRGGIKNVTVIDGGSNFKVDNPPKITVDPPSPLPNQTVFGETAELDLIINGKVTKVDIKFSGSNYTKVVVTAPKPQNNDPSIPFKEAILVPLIVKGKLVKIRVADPGFGYTKQPTILVTPIDQLDENGNPILDGNGNPIGDPSIVDAVVIPTVEGPIYKILTTSDDPNLSRGTRYNRIPQYKLEKGSGASAIATIVNGKLSSVGIVNAGNFYNSPPKVTIVDNTGSGSGAEVISEIDSNGKVTDFFVINPGLNYSNFDVDVIIEESGGGEILNIEIDTWTPINNVDYPGSPITLNNSDGSYFAPINFGDFEGVVPKFYSILGVPRKLKLDGTLVNFSNNVSINQKHSPIIGWALDGSPIYGPFGYKNPLVVSEIVRLQSSYELIDTSDADDIRFENNVTSIGLSNYAKGSLAEDYKFNGRRSTLDKNNGRFCVTPEYPNGVYAYFATILSSPNNSKNPTGFPYYIGSNYTGSTFSSFNKLQSNKLPEDSNLRRYISPNGNIYVKPIDPGSFFVDAVPTSADSSIDFVTVSSPGSNYKIGDKLVFDNSGTNGFGADGFVSSLTGSTISGVSKSTYDYLEYYGETAPFSAGDIITARGFRRTASIVDQKNKTIYCLQSTASNRGDNIKENSLIYSPTLRRQPNPVTILNENIGSSATDTAVFSNQRVRTETLLTFTSTIPSSFQVGKYLIVDVITQDENNIFNILEKDQTEYLKILEIVSPTQLLVKRGYLRTPVNFYDSAVNPVTVRLSDEIQVFDSSDLNIGDYIQLGGPSDEICRILDISVEKSTSVVGLDIIDGGDALNLSTLFLYLNGQLQSNGGNPSTVVTVSGNTVTDINFDSTNGEPFISNPLVQIGTSSVYENSTFIDANILASTYTHTLTVEREAFDSVGSTFSKQTQVTKLTDVAAFVKYFERDRILASFNAENNLLVQNDKIEIKAQSNINTGFVNASQIDVDNSGDISIQYLFAQLNSLGDVITRTFYEGSTYKFIASTTANIEVSFYTVSVLSDGTKTIGKDYYGLDIDKTFENGRLDSYSVKSKDSDLTEYVMRITNLNSNSIFKDYIINTIPEPLNGTFSIVDSTTNEFKVYSKVDPLPTGLSYNSQTVSYSTTSPSASGGINKVILTSGGFNYEITPGISEIKSENGVNGLVIPNSRTIGKINKISNVFSGFGFSPDPKEKPTIIFPEIVELSNNFTITGLNLVNKGNDYLFSPRVIVTEGGLGDKNNPNHAIIEATTKNGIIQDLILVSGGKFYNSSPTLTIEKYYFTDLVQISGLNVLSFKFAFSNFIKEGDSIRVRAYFTINGIEFIRESSNYIVGYNNNFVSCLDPETNIAQDPLLTIDFPSGTILNIRYEVISSSRVATATAQISKSSFIANEKVVFNNNNDQFAFVSPQKGWQEGRSVLRLINSNYKILPGDSVVGSQSKAFGTAETSEGITASTTIGPKTKTSKKFLDQKSFLGSSFLKLQDNNKYQKYAYEIGIDLPFSTWKDNYLKVAHPTGYNLFAKTTVGTKVSLRTTSISNVDVSSNITETVSLNRKYNYFVTKNRGTNNDEVQIYNKLLTDVNTTQTAIVAVFNDISDQFDGVKTSFELKVIDPINPKIPLEEDPDEFVDNFIEGYDIDQMVILLDNIIQTKGTSWFVTDSDKSIIFSGTELLPNEDISYRKFNDASIIYSYNEVTSSSSDTFSIVNNAGQNFPSVYSPVNEDHWLVFVDGACQLNDSFTITTNQIQFSETLPVETTISVRYISGLIKNEFTNGSYVSGNSLVLPNNLPNTTTKENYFVFVDGVLISTSDYELSAGNNIVFSESFNYDSVIIAIDPNGVSLSTVTETLIPSQFTYKILDGQNIIPEGIVISPESYVLDIAGVVQSPYLAYTTEVSGVRKINFREPPKKVNTERGDVGKQFVGLLYRRLDPTQTGTVRNYQFDDISINLLHVKQSPNLFTVGDFIIRDDNLVSSVISNKNTDFTRVTVLNGIPSTLVANNSTFTIITNSIEGIFVGDSVQYDQAIGLTSIDSNELIVSDINFTTNEITIQNISGGDLTLVVPNDGAIPSTIGFLHYTLEIEETISDASIVNKDNNYTNGDVLLSGVFSSEKTSTITNINQQFGVLSSDNTIVVDNTSGFITNDYILIDNTEIAKITNIVGTTFTLQRELFRSSSPVIYIDGTTVQKIVPRSLEVISYQRGFDGEKTNFELKEKQQLIDIPTDKDIFVIVNGILQKRPDSYVLNSTTNGSTTYTEIVFTEAPDAGTPFNCFYVGEQLAIEDISSQFNGGRTNFNLRRTNGEIFSFVYSEEESSKNISPNLILFIDGVYQIPSVTDLDKQAPYPDILSSYRLSGSSIQFTSPPAADATFDGFIYVGSPGEYSSIDIDPPTEEGDIIIQKNEVASREITQILGSNKVSVTNSLGTKLSDIESVFQNVTGEFGFFYADLIKSADVRESLRSRRSLVTVTTASYNPTALTLSSPVISTLTVEKFNSDLPATPDDQSNKLVINSAPTTNFSNRLLNCSYNSFNGTDTLNNVIIGYDLQFDQIVQVSNVSPLPTFVSETVGSNGNIIETIQESITYGGAQNTDYSANIVYWDATTRFLYLKLNNSANPVQTTDTIRINQTTSIGVVSDNLISEYLSFNSGDKIYYIF
jgi:hypothetical protein